MRAYARTCVCVGGVCGCMFRGREQIFTCLIITVTFCKSVCYYLRYIDEEIKLAEGIQ